jgi:hypothetical protein
MFGDHGESIYNIIPPKFEEQQRPPMHKSRSSGTLPPTASTFHNKSTTYPGVSNLMGDASKQVVSNEKARTMGRALGSCRNDPHNYMRKMAKTSSVPSLGEMKRSNPEMLKPSQLAQRKPGGGPPPPSEQPVMGIRSAKNFVVANAVEVILAAPKKVTPAAKDYLHKDDFGKVPKYLEHIKKDIASEYDYIRQLDQQREEEMQPQIRGVEEQERHQLIDGLKSKWEQVNTEYQGTTHITNLDTMGKMKRKEKHEAELAQLEKDIEKLNKRNLAVDMTQ